MKSYTKKDINLAWAAGFYDGEGSSKKKFYHYKTKKGVARPPTKAVCMAVAQAELAPLVKFRKAVGGLGCINGPYQYHCNKRPYWVWQASNAAARKVFSLLKKYLGTNKRLQFERVLLETRSTNTRKKGWIHDEA